MVAIALIVIKGGGSSSDLLSSLFVPSKVVFSILKFSLKSLSVLGCLGHQFLIDVHYLSELANCSSTDLFISLVFSISSELGINIGLFQIVEELENCINSIMSLSAGLEESDDLVMSRCGKSTGEKQHD